MTTRKFYRRWSEILNAAFGFFKAAYLDRIECWEGDGRMDGGVLIFLICIDF